MLVPIPIDIDGDGDVDAIDMSIVEGQLGLCIGDPGYNPAADLDGGGCVTDLDRRLIVIPMMLTIDVHTGQPPVSTIDDIGRQQLQ